MSLYGEHESHHYTPNSHYLQPPSLSSSASILNYDPSSPQTSAAAEHGHLQDYQDGQYKREPTTPTCPSMSHSDFSYPTPFTPSPSLSGSESPSTPAPYYQPAYPTLEGGERITIPFPAPTPPLSATHLGKDSHHVIPETEMKFSKEQVDCICDTLQQRKDMTMLGV